VPVNKLLGLFTFKVSPAMTGIRGSCAALSRLAGDSFDCRTPFDRQFASFEAETLALLLPQYIGGG
jgi:hypothetical protein